MIWDRSKTSSENWQSPADQTSTERLETIHDCFFFSWLVDTNTLTTDSIWEIQSNSSGPAFIKHLRITLRFKLWLKTVIWEALYTHSQSGVEVLICGRQEFISSLLMQWQYAEGGYCCYFVKCNKIKFSISLFLLIVKNCTDVTWFHLTAFYFSYIFSCFSICIPKQKLICTFDLLRSLTYFVCRVNDLN